MGVGRQLASLPYKVGHPDSPPNRAGSGLRRFHGPVRHLAGDPFDEVLVGPSSAVWGRSPGDYGRVIYVTTDGGTTAPPDGTVRNAALLRVELHAQAER